MTDQEYIKRQFEKECRDKKRIARGEQNRVKSNRGRMKTASDYMTAKERKKLNGEVVSVDMNKPVKWDVFKTLSKETQKEYVENLRSKYGVPFHYIAMMMGTSQANFKFWRTERGIKGEKGYKAWDKKGWEEFNGTVGEEIVEAEKVVTPERTTIKANKDDGSTELAISLLRALLTTAKGAKITIEIEV